MVLIKYASKMHVMMLLCADLVWEDFQKSFKLEFPDVKSGPAEVIAISTKDQIQNSYGRMDTGLRSYSQYDPTSYPSSSVSSQPYDAYVSLQPPQQPYGSSGLGGGYNTFRL